MRRKWVLRSLAKVAGKDKWEEFCDCFLNLMNTTKLVRTGLDEKNLFQNLNKNLYNLYVIVIELSFENDAMKQVFEKDVSHNP